MGPEGLRAAARLGVARAHALAQRLAAIPGCAITVDGPFFDRFTLRAAPGDHEAAPTDRRRPRGGGFDLRWRLLREANIIAGDATLDHYEKRDDLIIQCTEMTTDAEMDALVSAVQRVVSPAREKVAAR
jgi:glycine cleavage system pyridoxal-binding protein P